MKKHFSFQDLNNGQIHGVKAVSELQAWTILARVLGDTLENIQDDFSLCAIEELS